MDREQEEVVLRVTAHYVEEVQAGHQPKISDYLARYPQYADAIANFITYYQTVELSMPQSVSSPEYAEDLKEFTDELHIAIEVSRQRVLLPEVTRELADVEETIQILEVEESGEPGEPEGVVYGQPIQSLFGAAKHQQCSPSQLAAHLNISEDIVVLLEQRALLPESVPLELYRQLARTLQQPLDAVQLYLGSEHRQQVAEHPAVYGFGNTPQTSQKVSFRETVDKSADLSAEQKSFWRDVLTKEGL